MSTVKEVRNSQAELGSRSAGADKAVEYRLMELEKDKLSLQRLVTELLIKNQKLRESLARMPALAHADGYFSSL